MEELMEEASRTGAPVLRTLFYNYPQEEACWEIEDQIMLGRDILAAPILYAGMTERDVYLPGDDVWTDYYTGKEYRGGQTLHCDAPLSVIPFFIRKGFGGNI